MRHRSRHGFEYSNLGYAVLGQIIERVSGTAFTDFVTHELIEPLGLDMRFELPVDAAAPVATGYRRVGGDGWLGAPVHRSGRLLVIGGLFASATSPATWGSWLAEASTGGERGPLSAASRREMQQLMRVAPKRHSPPAVPGAPSAPSPVVFGYGFGLFVEFDERFGAIVSHSGGYPGFSAHMRWHAASGLGVVAFENATYARVRREPSSRSRSCSTRPTGEPGLLLRCRGPRRSRLPSPSAGL